MASGISDSSEGVVETCIFCLIANDQDKETEVIKRVRSFLDKTTMARSLPGISAGSGLLCFKNKELVCFRDINPAAPHHYLVVPRWHIYSCFSLHRGHIGLIERMVKMGKSVLHDQGITDMKDVRLGFHKPPFISVNHLHLHVLAPTSQIPGYIIYKFIPGNHIFITEEQLRERLKNIAPPLQSNKKHLRGVSEPATQKDRPSNDRTLSGNCLQMRCSH